MSSFEEFVFIDPTSLSIPGTSIRQDYYNRCFTIRFSLNLNTFFGKLANREIIDEKYKTVGEANIAKLHDLLDEFLSKLRAEGSSG